jgi:alkanesulfonate monooxygenase SsuD/methylene tetrahydromethanopterin reductase-like flavin-dependent oxidoreductase (luciferase family)
VIAQKPWPTVVAELEGYRERYRELNAEEPPAPILAVFVSVDDDRGRAEDRFERYVTAYSESALDHYQFDDAGIAEIPGYEYYAGLSQNIEKHGRDGFVRFLADLQVWGTPDEVTEQLIEYQRLCGAGGIIGVFSYGGMPAAEVAQNLDTFAQRVLPRLHDHPTPQGVGTAGGPTAMAAATSPTRVRW